MLKRWFQKKEIKTISQIAGCPFGTGPHSRMPNVERYRCRTCDVIETDTVQNFKKRHDGHDIYIGESKKGLNLQGPIRLFFESKIIDQQELERLRDKYFGRVATPWSPGFSDIEVINGILVEQLNMTFLSDVPTDLELRLRRFVYSINDTIDGFEHYTMAAKITRGTLSGLKDMSSPVREIEFNKSIVFGYDVFLFKLCFDRTVHDCDPPDLPNFERQVWTHDIAARDPDARKVLLCFQCDMHVWTDEQNGRWEKYPNWSNAPIMKWSGQTYEMFLRPQG